MPSKNENVSCYHGVAKENGKEYLHTYRNIDGDESDTGGEREKGLLMK